MAMIKPEKITVVKEYLTKHFLNYVIEDRYDYSIDAQVFKLTKFTTRYLTKVSEDFFSDKSVKEVKEGLDENEFAEVIRENEFPVLLTGRGIKVLKD